MLTWCSCINNSGPHQSPKAGRKVSKVLPVSKGTLYLSLHVQDVQQATAGLTWVCSQQTSSSFSRAFMFDASFRDQFVWPAGQRCQRRSQTWFSSQGNVQGHGKANVLKRVSSRWRLCGSQANISFCFKLTQSSCDESAGDGAASPAMSRHSFQAQRQRMRGVNEEDAHICVAARVAHRQHHTNIICTWTKHRIWLTVTSSFTLTITQTVCLLYRTFPCNTDCSALHTHTGNPLLTVDNHLWLRLTANPGITVWIWMSA